MTGLPGGLLGCLPEALLGGLPEGLSNLPGAGLELVGPAWGRPGACPACLGPAWGLFGLPGAHLHSRMKLALEDWSF